MQDSFMVPEMSEDDYYAVQANHGETHIVPADVVRNAKVWGDLADYVDGEIDDPDGPALLSHGWLWRFQAPGYMDATDWSYASTEREAIEDMLSQHECDDVENMESWEYEARFRLLELDGLGRFECVEHFNCYAVKDRITGDEASMSDGVDVFGPDDDGNPGPKIGTEAFRKAWEDELNSTPDETLEAYFPEQHAREND